MTDHDKRARELLAAEYPKDDAAHDEILRGEFSGEMIDPSVALRAITAALREVPEGWALVRKEAIEWLNGESEEGFECPPDRYFRDAEPRYWWRSVFREKAGLAAAQEKSDE